MVGLGFLPGLGNISRAVGASAVGSIVVGSSCSFSVCEAFIWDATHGMRSLQQVLTADGLNLTGWSLEDATGISADGQTIVGSGIDPSGHGEAWLVNFAIIPEPGTGLLVLTGLMALAVARGRRQHV